jgi:hypothetical protein
MGLAGSGGRRREGAAQTYPESAQDANVRDPALRNGGIAACRGSLVSQQAQHQPHHEVLLGRPALRDQQRERCRRRVHEARLAIRAQQQAVAAQVLEKQQGADALVPVGEGMILHDEVQQVRGALLR